MSITLEDLLNTYGNKLNEYASDKSKIIENSLSKYGIKTYEVQMNEQIGNGYITFNKLEDFLSYLVEHSIKELFKSEEDITPEVFLLHFLNENEEIKIADQSKVKRAYDLYAKYLQAMLGDGIKLNIVYYTIASPKIKFACSSDIENIIEVEREIIEKNLQVQDELNEIKTKLDAAEDELKSAYDFLVNDPEFKKCTNVNLRSNYTRRGKLFEQGRFKNLLWLIDNDYMAKAVLSDEVNLKKIRNIIYDYNAIYDLAWREIKGL